jgi:hypothetical protein
MKKTTMIMGKEKLRLRLRRVDPYFYATAAASTYIIARWKLYGSPSPQAPAAITKLVSVVRPGAILDTLY